MRGLWKLALTALTVGSFVAAGAPASAAEPGAGQAPPLAIAGHVVAETGTPLEGAVVSVIGPTATLALTDAHGDFAIRALPAGRYVLQARKLGRTPSPQISIVVVPQSPARVRLMLVPAGVKSTAASAIVEYPVLAAGFAPGSAADAELPPSNPRETAWRLRHLRRSVLKDANGQIAALTDDGGEAVNDWLRHAAGDRRAALAPDFGDFSALSGELNLLTVGSFDNPQQIFSADGFSHGVAYLSIGSPANERGAWTVRGAMTQGEFASWVLAGTYVADLGDHHHYQVGLVYGMQRPDRPSAVAVDSSVEGGRNIGVLRGTDTWTLSRRVAVGYGLDYTRYDYDGSRALVDPHAMVSLEPATGLVVRASAERRSRVPGAEELMLPTADGVWLPPQHAVSLLAADNGVVAPERAQQYRVEVARQLGAHSDVTVGAYYQQVEHQLATLFSLGEDSAAPAPRYFVGDDGHVAVRGYDVRVTHAITNRIQGSVSYGVSTAEWSSGGPLLLASLAPAVVRQGTERLQDVSTSLVTDIPETATHVLMLYRVSTGFAGSDAASQPGLGYRFDVRVTQGLPFLHFNGTEWQALVGVRNFFQDSTATASSLDELLVVHAPKLIVGGLMLRF